MTEFASYKTITSKLQKKLLRNPSFGDAIKQFTTLSRLLKDFHCYAGYCHLAVARCEAIIGNQGGRLSALLDAARAFSHGGEGDSDINAAIKAYQQALLICDRTMSGPINLELARVYELHMMYHDAAACYKSCMNVNKCVQSLVMCKCYDAALDVLNIWPRHLMTTREFVTLFLLELLLKDANTYHFSLPITLTSPSADCQSPKGCNNSDENNVRRLAELTNEPLVELNELLESLVIYFKRRDGMSLNSSIMTQLINRLSPKLETTQLHLLHLISTLKSVQI